MFAWWGWQEPAQLLLPVTALFVMMALLAAVVRLVLNWASNRFVFGMGYDLSVEVYRRTLYQPYPFHVAKNTSEIIGGINKVQIVINSVFFHF